MFYLYFNESIKVPKFRFQIALNYIYFITLMLIGFMFGILNELLYRPSILTKSIRAVAASAETNWPGRDPTTKVAYTTLALFHRLTQKDRYIELYN